MDPIQLTSEATRERQEYLRLTVLMQEIRYEYMTLQNRITIS
jgi:hypothetical protein